MRFRYENSAANSFWEAELVDVELTIRTGTIGTPGEAKVIEDAYESADVPPEVLIDQLVEQLPPGYRAVLPDDLLALVEQGQAVRLQGRLRRFYEAQEYKQHQGKRCNALECRVHFASAPVQGQFFQDYYDAKRKAHVKLIPISTKVSDSGYEDEQQWIGVDPALADGPVYALYTSGSFEEAYPSLDVFLADLE